LPRADVPRLLDRFKAKGIRLIFDDSSTDFVDGTADPSLLETSILEEYPNAALPLSA